MSAVYTGTIRKVDIDDRTVVVRLGCSEADMRMLARVMAAGFAVDLAAPNVEDTLRKGGEP